MSATQLSRPAIRQGANPYVGPRTFTHEQGHLFFGREQEAEELFSRVVSQRLVLFYAQSGAGKSSLINARLIPQLKAAGFVPLPVGRVSGEMPAGIPRLRNIFLFNLLASLDQHSDLPVLANLSLPYFLAGLTSDNHGETWHYIDPTIEENNDSWQTETYHQPKYVLIIDQFEEIVTNHLDRWQERPLFFRELDAAMQSDPNLWIVLALREDYVASLDPYAHLLNDKLRARYYMQKMNVGAAIKAIRQPAELAGRPFASGVAEKLVDNLRQILGADDATDQLGEFIEPVQLQIVCYQMWEQLRKRPLAPITLEDLREYGDVGNALALFYEKTLTEVLHETQVPTTELELRQWFSTKLITPYETRNLLALDFDKTSGIPNDIIFKLEERFLLRSELRSGTTFYELIHDSFVNPILRSNQGWRPDVSGIKRKNLLKDATEIWLMANRDPTKLLTGVDLQQAQLFADENSSNVSALQREFLDKSLAQELGTPQSMFGGGMLIKLWELYLLVIVGSYLLDLPPIYSGSDLLQWLWTSFGWLFLISMWFAIYLRLRRSINSMMNGIMNVIKKRLSLTNLTERFRK